MTAPVGEHRSLDSLVRPGDVAMITTLDAGGALSARPLTVAAVHGGVLAFLVDGAAPWVAQLDDHPEVGLTVTTGRNDWVCVRGRTATTTDADAIERLSSPAASAFFSDESVVTALQVSVIDGDWWSSPGGGPLGRLVSVVGAAFGREDSASSHGDVIRD